MGLINGSTGFAVGFATGFGTGVLLRDSVPDFKSVASPALKLLMKATLLAAERSREGLARFAETLQDLMAEAQMELKTSKVAEGRNRKKARTGRNARPKKRRARAPGEARHAQVIPLRKMGQTGQEEPVT